MQTNTCMSSGASAYVPRDGALPFLKVSPQAASPYEGGTHMGLLWFLIIGLVAGWLAGMLVKGGGFGLIGDLVVGVVGAFLGGFLFGALGISGGGGFIGSVAVATIGAVVLLFIVRLTLHLSPTAVDCANRPLVRAPCCSARVHAKLSSARR